MDEGRLGIVRRQENSRRKFVFMLNEVMRSQCKVVGECLTREKFEIGVKHDKSFVSVRRAVVKQRVLQQCLKMKRQNRRYNDRQFGVYGGKPLYTFSRDIDKFIAEMHPRYRRLRKAEKDLNESIEKGKILDPKVIPTKIEQYFEKNWKKDKVEIKPKPIQSQQPTYTDIFKNSRHTLPPIRGLLNTYKVNHSKNDNDIHDERQEASLPLSEEINVKQDQRLEPNPVKPKDHMSRESTRGLLILPPIQQTKKLVQR